MSKKFTKLSVLAPTNNKFKFNHEDSLDENLVALLKESGIAQSYEEALKMKTSYTISLINKGDDKVIDLRENLDKIDELIKHDSTLIVREVMNRPPLKLYEEEEKQVGPQKIVSQEMNQAPLYQGIVIKKEQIVIDLTAHEEIVDNSLKQPQERSNTFYSAQDTAIIDKYKGTQFADLGQLKQQYLADLCQAHGKDIFTTKVCKKFVYIKCRCKAFRLAFTYQEEEYTGYVININYIEAKKKYHIGEKH